MRDLRNLSSVIISIFIICVHADGAVEDNSTYTDISPYCKSECSDGKFYCSCPGNGDIVFHHCDRSYCPGCNRWRNCGTCRSGMKHNEPNPCLSCLPGFEAGDHGYCEVDIDECSLSKDECEQICVNTYGSYYCLCNEGYKLADDHKSCIALTCSPITASGELTVEPTNAWKVGSYALYTCSDQRKTLSSDQYIECKGMPLIESEDTWWEGEEPQCIDSCKRVFPADRVLCGNKGITQKRCKELGCCYDPLGGKNRCYHNRLRYFLEQRGRRPADVNGRKPSEGYLTYERHTQQSCAYLCAVEQFGTCRSFGYRNRGFNKRALVSDYRCHLLDEHLSKFTRLNQTEKDANYTGYFDIPYNWEVNDNQSPVIYRTWQEFTHDALLKQYLGCYRDDPSDRDLPFHVATDSTNTVYACVTLCRNRGFSFAGIQNGIDCFCGNSVVRKHGAGTDCTATCSEDDTLACGGATSNSIYSVSLAEHYLGCYKADSSFLKIWDRSENRSAGECVDFAARGSVFFAAIGNGGDCYVGNVIPGTAVDESACAAGCRGWGRQNCGGEDSIALFRTETRSIYSIDQSEENQLNFGAVIHEKSQTITGFPTSIFTLYQGLQRLYLKRFALVTTEVAQAPEEDSWCTDNCYTRCGEIYHPKGLINDGENVTLRMFYFRLSEVNKYIGNNTKRVYVYAQTTVIDEDVTLEVALFLRTRQLIVDRSRSRWISLSSSNTLDYDPHSTSTLHRVDGWEDLLHMKQSVICARILLDAKAEPETNLAWAILRDISNVRSEDPEVRSYSSSVRALTVELAGVYRTDVHFVPFYTKSHLAKLLETYADEIDLYKDRLDRVVDSTLNALLFIEYAEGMNGIYADSDMAEASTAYESVLSALRRSEKTYERLRDYYNEAHWSLELIRRDLEQELNDQRDNAILSFTLNFIKTVARVYVGDLTIDLGDLTDDVDDVDDITEDIDAIFATMRTLSETIHRTNELFSLAEEVITAVVEAEEGADLRQYQDDIEMTIQLEVNIVQWKNLKNFANTLLLDPDLQELDNAAPYRRQMLDVANWGEALTRSMVERAELLREAQYRRSQLDLKKSLVKRVDSHLAEFRRDLTQSRGKVIHDLIEQSYSVRMDLNEALLMFCQAYFYENMVPCKSNYQPKFGGDFTELLQKINAAKRDDLLVGEAPSTVSRYVHIRDNVTDPKCNDAKVCPLNYLRRHRILYYDLPVHHPDLNDLDAFKVSEIFLDFEGANATGLNKYLKVGIESSGSFIGTKDGKVFHFLTRALALVYEYNIENGHISIHANVYEPFRSIIHHITPYTTWVMTVSPTRSADIDLSNLTGLRMRLDGSAIPGPLSKRRALK